MLQRPGVHDAVAERFNQGVSRLRQELGGLSAEKTNEALLGKNGEERARAVTGLVGGVLLDTKPQTDYFEHLLCVCDGLTPNDDKHTHGPDECIQELRLLSREIFSHMTDQCQRQLVWLVKECVAVHLPGVHTAVAALLSHLAQGQAFVWLAEELVGLLELYREWLVEDGEFVAGAFYCLLCRAAMPCLHHLRPRMLALCGVLWDLAGSECRQGGSELVVTLTAFPPEAAIAHCVGALSPPHIPTRTTPAVLRSLVLASLPNDCCEWLTFMVTQVCAENSGHYQRWFARRFLASPDHETVLPEMIRFVCHCVPQATEPHAQPRFLLLGWLLVCSAKSTTLLRRCCTALVVDFLFFSEEFTSLHSLAPVLHLAQDALGQQPRLAISLLSELVDSVDERGRAGDSACCGRVGRALDALWSNRLVRSLEWLMHDERIPAALRARLGGLCSSACRQAHNQPP